MYFFTLPSAVSLIALAIGVAYGAPTGAVKAKRWDDLDSQVVLFTMTGTDGSTYMLQTYPIDGQSHNLVDLYSQPGTPAILSAAVPSIGTVTVASFSVGRMFPSVRYTCEFVGKAADGTAASQGYNFPDLQGNEDMWLLVYGTLNTPMVLTSMQCNLY